MKHTDSYNKPEANDASRIKELIGRLDYESSFESAAGWLSRKSRTSTQTKPKRRIQMLKDFFAAKKIRIAYAFIALAFVVAACNYPVATNENAGDVITWTIPAENTDAISRVSSLPWLSKGPVRIEQRNAAGNSESVYSFVIPKEEHMNAAKYKSDLEGIPGVSSIKITELSQTVKRPVYSAILHGLFRIDINATNMSDEELKTEITSQLRNAGVTDATVTIVRNGELRRVKIDFPESAVPNGTGFDMTITDGNSVERIKQLRKEAEPGKFDGKTDDEIRRIVREDFPDADLRDEEIQIIREDGKVRVKVVKEREN